MTFAEAVKTVIFENPDGKIIRCYKDGTENMLGYYFVKPIAIPPINPLDDPFTIPGLYVHFYETGEEKRVPYTMYKRILDQVNNRFDADYFRVVNDIYLYPLDYIEKNIDIKVKFPSLKSLSALKPGDYKNGDIILVYDALYIKDKIIKHNILFKVIDETKLGTMDALEEYNIEK